MSEPTVLLADNDEGYRKSPRRLLEGEAYLAEEAASVGEQERSWRLFS